MNDLKLKVPSSGTANTANIASVSISILSIACTKTRLQDYTKNILLPQPA